MPELMTSEVEEFWMTTRRGLRLQSARLKGGGREGYCKQGRRSGCDDRMTQDLGSRGLGVLRILLQ